MIILSYLGDYRSFDLERGLNLLIVRRPPLKIPSHFIHAPQLSPSPGLFKQTQEWKLQYGEKKNWFHLYENQFLREIEERDDLRRALKKVEVRVMEGKEVRMFCYCSDENCHRKYIGLELQRRGYEVDIRKKKVVEQMSLF